MHGIKAKAPIRVEKHVNLALKKLKLKILGQPYDEVLLTTDRQYKDYKANDGIILNDCLMFLKYYGETSSVKYYQILIPKQVVDEVVWGPLGEFGKHPGITKTIKNIEILIPQHGVADQKVGHVV